MKNLLKKEFILAMHPTSWIMLALACMVIIPNYPYVVIFFYTTLGIFFTCITGRENKDPIYTLNLPVEKKDIVKSRILYAIMVEVATLILMIPFCFLSQYINVDGNVAGMDANISLIALGLIIYAFFNFFFFTSYYKNINKIGLPFALTSTVLGFICVLDAVFTNAVPLFKDRLDTLDPQFITEKLIFLVIGIIIFIVSNILAIKISIKRFEKQDIN